MRLAEITGVAFLSIFLRGMEIRGGLVCEASVTVRDVEAGCLGVGR